ncbi:disulfide bond formation protein DsbA [Paenibacillus elgii]|uniref:Disulfide bond formation protein DsbA n=1 Tax=Paenibacillus elgii TaxID=189691 RepID=A0A163UNA1_9BACL|nr:MDR family MFS transporter [Paenibacillus elgii]KZE73578.1 disulfide bond formation protein DsbA [Paenibacillus elgii]
MKGGPSPKVVVCIVYVAAMFMAAMDATVLNVALGTISRELNIPPAASGALNVGYLASLALVLPVAGWLGDRWGSKRILLLALGLFTGASALCGLADGLAELTAYRVLQGIGGGLLAPVGMAMLFRAFPPQERAKVSRALVLPIAAAPALGPIVSGLLTDQFSWRWIFYINLPVGIPILLFGLLYLREHKEPEAGRLDLPGFLLSAPGMALTMYALSQGPVLGWRSPWIVGTGLLGLLLLAALVAVELRAPKPMLDMRLLRDRLFRTAGLVGMCSAAGLLGMLYVFPLMYQYVLGASALETGLTTFPEALGLMASSQLVPWSYPKLGPKRLIMTGLLCTTAIFVLLSFVHEGTDPWLIRSLLFGVGVCLGHTVGAVQIASFANIPPSSMGRASTWFSVQNRLGSAIGLAVLSGILAAVGTGAVNAAGFMAPNLMAYRFALLGAAGFLLLGLWFAFGIRDSDAAATLRKRGAPVPVKPVGERSSPAEG